MKKMIFSIVGAVVILGTRTAVFAAESCDLRNINLGQMKKHMEEVHPGMTTQEMKDMYKDCHGMNGAMQSKNFQMMDGTKDMMSQF
ncbi:hypothetical protein [Neobacillus terrae]|uniref:hypothetical protein n=1 Tax=Neobacillus terrae TaxID=3034837 RepID=UPI00140BA5BC|nr:hypothetical protein [Neobacillus terrae]NHM32584.1 hypothetical protein [Neobacillus terrae]